MRRIRIGGILAMLAVTFACMDMDVENINAPDADQALAEPGDVEALLGTGFYHWVNATKKDPEAARTVRANEMTSSWGNFGMQDAGTLPRSAYDNSPTASYSSPNRLPWARLYDGLSSVADGILAIEQGMRFEDGEDDDTDRARAYGRFAQGVLTGWLALDFDQAFVFDEVTLAAIQAEEGDPEMSPYPEIMAKAIEYLEEAIQISESSTFQLPSGEAAWIHGKPLTNDELAQWAHSFAAKYLASVARTPAERAEVDWERVLYHLDRGVQETTGIGPAEQSPNLWWCRTCERPDGWMRAAYDLIGPADTSGGYEEWLAADPHDRELFPIVTDDRRITGPDGPEDDGTYVRFVNWNNVYPVDRGMYFQSPYFFMRFRDEWIASGLDGEMPIFVREQQGHWRAEALLRLGQNRNEAIDLINDSRVNNGELPPLPYDASDDEVWSTLLYEKALEQAGMMGSMNFYDRRGFGTLICGTPLHYPIPGGQLELMMMPSYTFGGSGDGAADPSTGCRTAHESAVVPRP